MTGILALALSHPLHAQTPARTDIAALQRILVAEDARGTGPEGIKPLLDALGGRDTLLRRVAVRGLGRLQQPDLARRLAPALADPVAAVRAEAGNAIAQSISRVTRKATDSGQVDVRWAAGMLGVAVTAERDAATADALVEALGRLPFGDTATAQAAQRTIVGRSGLGLGQMHALYSIAANRSSTGGLSADGIALSRTAARSTTDARVRRLAIMALTPAGALDSVTVFRASNDPDEQVRRLALGGLRTLSADARDVIVTRAIADLSPIVGVAAIAALRAGNQRPDCAPIIAVAAGSHPHVMLTAIDELGAPCADSALAATALRRAIDRAPAVGGREWQAPAHALVSLARIDRAGARSRLPAFATSTERGKRIYAAHAAAIVGELDVLRWLARDRDNNVREAAIEGLAAISKHASDSLYIAGLSATGYQAVLASASALAGSTDPLALPALLDNFDRLSAQRRENSRDPRIAILKRVGEMGSNQHSGRLTPYLADFDTTVATTVATILTQWSGQPVSAQTVRLPIAPRPLAATLLARNVDMKVTMTQASGGGTFTVRLFTDEAPATCARIIALARAHWYDQHLFQRVEPDFVVQGGGPDASEYVGDAAFMRDELSWHSHFRGTLGVSSRGRDTGDAQWFFNLIDNTRLDHDYTVFGEITAGRDVVEQILEGDAIARVDVIGRP